MKTLTALCLLVVVGTCAAVTTWEQGINPQNSEIFNINRYEDGVKHCLAIHCNEKFTGTPKFPNFDPNNTVKENEAALNNEDNFKAFVGTKICSRSSSC